MLNPSNDKDEPRRPNARREIAEPTCATSKTEREAPTRAIANMDSDEPNRENDLRANDAPTFAMSSTARDAPKRVVP